VTTTIYILISYYIIKTNNVFPMGCLPMDTMETLKRCCAADHLHIVTDIVYRHPPVTLTAFYFMTASSLEFQRYCGSASPY